MNDAPIKRPRLAGEDRSVLAAQLKSRYDAGESIRMLAAATGRSYGFVHRLLSEAGVELRGRGGPTRKA
ncbi:helix-turn-helix domain-containing protein [Nocardiopsis synnemataformans]|uniref:helix-turn-helix domain-containing protein n=1 Tax=Nocardiopsis dassonvillei TaxID=2014 RepID=UPI00034B556C